MTALFVLDGQPPENRTSKKSQSRRFFVKLRAAARTPARSSSVEDVAAVEELLDLEAAL
jgi:hypothetical protein